MAKIKNYSDDVQFIQKASTAVPANINDVNLLIAAAEAALAQSELATGVKFSSDDLANAPFFVLLDCEIAEFTNKSGENTEFAVCAISVPNGDEMLEGYTNGGTSLTKLVRTIIDNGVLEVLRAHGLKLNAEWQETAAGFKFLKIECAE